MIKDAIQSLVSGRSLTMDEAAGVMGEIMEGGATPAQIGAFTVALTMKGETVDEIAGLAKAMRARAVRVAVSGPVVDTCGTGGDGLNTFNISTAAAFVVAGAGLKVAKHGNRAASSRCGSADVLESLGVRVELNAAQVERCLEEVGIGFMFALAFHPAMKYAAAPRRELGIRTVFNMLGPLTNPAGAGRQVIGVAQRGLVEMMSGALCRLGAEHALVVHGLGGMDEVSITGRTLVWEIKGGGVSGIYHVSPEDFGMRRALLKSIQGGTPAENAEIIRLVLAGERSPRRDVVIMNAAAALLVGGGVATLGECAARAAEAIDSGRARAKLEELVRLTQRLAGES